MNVSAATRLWIALALVVTGAMVVVDRGATRLAADSEELVHRWSAHENAERGVSRARARVEQWIADGVSGTPSHPQSGATTGGHGIAEVDRALRGVRLASPSVLQRRDAALGMVAKLRATDSGASETREALLGALRVQLGGLTDAVEDASERVRREAAVERSRARGDFVWAAGVLLSALTLVAAALVNSVVVPLVELARKVPRQATSIAGDGPPETRHISASLGRTRARFEEVGVALTDLSRGALEVHLEPEEPGDRVAAGVVATAAALQQLSDHAGLVTDWARARQSCPEAAPRLPGGFGIAASHLSEASRTYAVESEAVPADEDFRQAA